MKRNQVHIFGLGLALEIVSPRHDDIAVQKVIHYMSGEPVAASTVVGSRVINVAVENEIRLEDVDAFITFLTSELVIPDSTDFVVVRVPWKVRGDIRARLKSELVAAGYMERTDNDFVRVVPVKVLAGCTRLLKVTKDNVDELDKDALVPLVYALCPGYLNGYFRYLKISDNTAYILMDDTGMPCAAATVKPDEYMGENNVTLQFLCSVVKGAGKVLFEHVLRDEAAAGNKTLTLEPANDTLKEMYKAWIGPRKMKSPNPLYYLKVRLGPLSSKRTKREKSVPKTKRKKD